MRTSDAGISFIERHEGVVLRAYRDPVGIWTIGAGLTKASGVVRPVHGMKISAAEASVLLRRALSNSYEPEVAEAMPRAEQHEFDGGVSFHFNTGAIGRASWARAWRARNWPAVAARIVLWNKAGGKVLDGLVRRRHEEYQLIATGDYGAVKSDPAKPGMARFVVPLSRAEEIGFRDGLIRLGYRTSDISGSISRAAVEAFQRDHDLTVDGLIGRATFSTMRRMIDARRKSAVAVGVGAAATGGGAALPGAGALPIDGAVLGASGGLLWLLWTLWHYRDALAALIAGKQPKIAHFLRSF